MFLLSRVTDLLNTPLLSLLSFIYAQAGVTLPTTGDSFLDRVINTIQKYVDLSTGAIAIGLAAVGFIAAGAIWFLSPKEGFMSLALKVVAFGIFILNVPVFVRALQFS